MVSRHIHLQLILRTVLLTLTSLGLGFLFFDGRYVLCALALVLLIVQTYFLIYYVNQTNRKIAYFFDAIKNEDFTLRFPEKLSVRSLKELNHSLNTLNSMIQDIHLKKQAQEQFYQEILKHADIGIMTINPKGHILYANPSIEKLLNYHPLNHVKQLKQIDIDLYEKFADLQPFGSSTHQLTNEREKTDLALKTTAINVDDQALLLVLVQDIRKELDEKETDSWVKLIRVLTHEIMNTITPITSISESILKYYKKGQAEALSEELPEQHLQSTVKGLEVIREQGNDLMNFVQSYRKFLSVPDPDRELIPAIRLLDKVKMLLGEKSGISKAEIELSVVPKDLELYIDVKQITQVLVNLGKNAQQSLGDQENGKIELWAGIDKKNKKFIQVRDNGPGISPDMIDEIFVPFFTTKRTGTGIGLSLSKQIMRLHRGNIQVNSNEETVFTLTFD
ncbi:sensor histidine kinase [Pseudozobellia thermophila]|uniref:histidine kinase n=1 Tax=Pseudozobellia thermophila TaxID=192903 RepID=A0A1M6AF40_9FLAO|nr:ATP-binding protein [Pseudozobellia thermophila]SHI35150.1 Histidine kinase-, DNA gyrase B-, and HSP90-like ATPase [Pseudozobellia thermophila]